jgi:DNA-binding NarL/FixJ family response regulator
VKAIRVAIACDRSLFCEGMSELLRQQQGIDVVAQIVDGDLAAGIGDETCDVLIADYSLLGGDEITAFLEAIKRTAPRVKLLLLLEEDLPDETLMRYLRMGVNGYVRGTATTAQLVEAIRVVASGTLWAERKLLNRFVAVPALPTLDAGAFASKTQTLLTRREREIVSLLLHGLPNKTLSERLHISESTVKTHLNNIYRKMSVTNRVQLLTSILSPS